MLEKQIEDHLVRRIKALGGVAFKFTSQGRRSVPDRICILPNAGLVFVELKAPGKKPTPKQAVEIARLRALGQTVLVIDSKEGVDEAFPR